MNGGHWLMVGALLGASAVVLGAYHAHGLEVKLKDVPQVEREKRLDHGTVALRYHMYHSLAIVALSLYIRQRSSWRLQVAGAFWLGGLALFCGSLYASALFNRMTHWSIVPSGGLLFILGWITLSAEGLFGGGGTDSE